MRLSLKKGLLEGLADDATEEEKDSAQQEVDWVSDEIRWMQQDINYSKRHTQWAQNELDRLINEDAKVKSQEDFWRENTELINLRNEKQLVFDEATAAKAALESQIELLNDILWSQNDDEIIEEINGRIEEFKNSIVEREAEINDAQEAFNYTAQQTLEIEAARIIEEADQLKEDNFLEAQRRYNEIKGLVEDTKMSLQYFDEDQGDETEINACEPQFLYALDENMMPQMSWEAVDIINSVIQGYINTEDPELSDWSVLPATVNVQEVKKLFRRNDDVTPPGFENLELPGQEKEEYGDYGNYGDYGDYGDYGYYGTETYGPDDFDPVALGFHDGSLQ